MLRRISCRMLSSLVVISFLNVGSAAFAQDVVKIGIVAPLTGPAANSGIALEQGMQLAANDWNAKGGVTIDGQKVPVSLIFEDSQSRPEVGVSAAQKLITVDKIDLLVGEAFHSSVTMAIMDLSSQYKIPILSGEPVSSEIAKKIKANPEKYSLFWKGDFNSEAYADAVAGLFKDVEEAGSFKPTKKKIAFVIEDTDYGRSNETLMASKFTNEGWTVSGVETVPLAYSDFYPQLTKLRADEPDVVISIFTAVNSGVSFVKQYQELGVGSLHIGVYYPLRSEFLEQAGDAADGLVWMPMMFDPANPAISQFSKRISDTFHSVASADHAFGNGIMNLAIEAIDKAGKHDPTAISEAIGATDYQGVYGHWAFDKDHVAKSGPDYLPLPGAQIVGGKSVVIFPKNRATAAFTAQPWTQ